MSMTAENMYGAPPQVQPTPTAAPTHAPGTPEPMARTEPMPGTNPVQNPTLLLLVLFAVAIWLIHFSVGFDFKANK